MKLKRTAARLLFGLLVLAMLPAKAAEEPYDFYAILELTGPAAFLGHSEQITLAVAERYINATGGIKGRPLHIVIQDDQSSGATAVALANQIFAKHVPAFIGPGFGVTCSALQPLVAASGPVMYCLSNVIEPPNGSYAFAISPSVKDSVAIGFRYLKAKGVRKIGMLTTTDASGKAGEAGALETLKLPEFNDTRLVANEYMAASDLTVNAQVARIKAAGAQAFVAWTPGTAFGTALRGVQDGAFSGIVMTNSANINKAQMAQYAQLLPRDLVFVGLPSMTVGIMPAKVRLARTTFLDQMHQSGIGEPDLIQFLAWDPMLILVDALRHAGTQATATQVRDYILKTHDYTGTNGTYDFRRGDQRGLDPLSSPVVRWDKGTGEFVAISKPGGVPF